MPSGVQRKSLVLWTLALTSVLFAGTVFVAAQQPEPAAESPAKQDAKPESQPPTATPEYKPKFAGDPAHSDAEAGNLGYIRTVLTAQKLYKKKHNAYATSLAGLVNTGSFTRRMIKTDRGDYDVSFHSKADGFSLALTPKHFDAAHRAFYADDTGVLRVETDKPAKDHRRCLAPSHLPMDDVVH